MTKQLKHLRNLFILFAVTSLTLGSNQLMAQQKVGGLALYTVREDMSKDPLATLEKVSGTGYAYVEAARNRICLCGSSWI